METDMMIKDFGGNMSKPLGAINVELTIGSKTLLTTFFVIDGKGSYSLLLGRDWIHANCCIPSTMYQCLIQWHGDDVELVCADESMSITTADPVFWELGDFECFLVSHGKDASLRSPMKANSRCKRSALRVYFRKVTASRRLLDQRKMSIKSWRWV